MSSMVKEFKTFILRGNLVELAVAVIIALYFQQVVDAFTNGIVLALVAAIFGEPNFESITIGVGDADLLVGVFLNAVINFVLVALVLFLVVRAYNAVRARTRAQGEEVEEPSREERVLVEIRDLLRERA